MKQFLAACIIETRPIEKLDELIKGHMDKLPCNTKLFIFHSSVNEYLKEKFPSATFVKLQDGSDLSIHEYNHIITRASFWDFFSDYHRVLIFQSDSMILRTGIEQFMEWDYIGSCWAWQDYGFNGGCSLRNPKAMLEICSENQWSTLYGNEDVFFSNIMYKNTSRWKLAPREAGMKFGVEAVFSLGSFCIHAIEKYLSKEQVNQILTQYEGTRI